MAQLCVLCLISYVNQYFFTMQRYASAVYAVTCVCRSVTNRHCTKWLNIGSRK